MLMTYNEMGFLPVLTVPLLFGQSSYAKFGPI